MNKNGILIYFYVDVWNIPGANFYECNISTKNFTLIDYRFSLNATVGSDSNAYLTYCRTYRDFYIKGVSKTSAQQTNNVSVTYVGLAVLD